MSELTEQRWAVLSERGCEALGLTYAQAFEMMHALVRQKISGVSVITDDAARRAAPNVSQQARRLNSNGTKAKARQK